MYLISPEGNAGAYCLRIKKTIEHWPSMKNVQNGLGVKNIFDLNLKEVNGRYETENLRNEHIRKKKSKMTERESFEKYDNFSENELNTKSNKEVYVKMMS